VHRAVIYSLRQPPCSSFSASQFNKRPNTVHTRGTVIRRIEVAKYTPLFLAKGVVDGGGKSGSAQEFPFCTCTEGKMLTMPKGDRNPKNFADRNIIQRNLGRNFIKSWSFMVKILPTLPSNKSQRIPKSCVESKLQ